VSTQLDYGQVGTAISKLYGDDVVLGNKQLDTTTGRLLEALLELHASTAIDLAHFPEVDALARLIAPTDFDCCSTGTPAHEKPKLTLIDTTPMCPCGCGSTAARAMELDQHMGYL
jgi:hypothetical protein